MPEHNKNEKQESYFSKKDFYGKVKDGQERFSCDKSAQENEKQNPYTQVCNILKLKLFS